MRKRFVALVVLGALILTMSSGLFGCGKQMDDATPADVDSTQSMMQMNGAPSADVDPPQSMTLMIYMVGSDLESANAAGSKDIHEMLDSNVLTKDFHVLLCTGGSSMWWEYDIPNDQCTVYELCGSELKQVHTLQERNMGEPNTLKEFVNYGREAYPADGYSLLLWDHGGGTMIGCGADENYGFDLLSISELRGALRECDIATQDGGFEWIGFDACLMGMIEVADAVSPYAKYMVASEEMEDGNGWDYGFLEEMGKKKAFGGIGTAQCIIDNYDTYYKEHYTAMPDYTLSCLALDQIEEVTKALAALANVADAALLEGKYPSLSRIRNAVRSFGRQATEELYDSVDLYDLASQMERLYPQQCQDLKDALDKMLIYQATSVESAHGVAVYFPYVNKVDAQKWIEYYQSLYFDPTYTLFIKRFTDVLTGNPLYQWDDFSRPMEMEATQDGICSLQLTTEELENFGYAYASIWEKKTYNEKYGAVYTAWQRFSNVTMDENGLLTAKFDPSCFYMQDASGATMQCTAIEVDRTALYSKYTISTIVWRKSEMRYIAVGYMDVLVDAEHPDGQIIGIYEDTKQGAQLLPAKREIKLIPGDDVVSTIWFSRKLEFDAQGNVLPFANKPDAYYGEEMDITDANLTITRKPLDPNGEYYCMFMIMDTQGNLHNSSLVKVPE